MTLFDFQKKAIRSLLEEIIIHKNSEIYFKAPTGSGKTVMLSKLMDSIFQFGSSTSSTYENMPAVDDLEIILTDDFVEGLNELKATLQNLEFVWLSPSIGGLANQSKTSFDSRFTSSTNTLQEFVHEPAVNENDITFIGMSSINSKDNIVNRDTETKNWKDAVDERNLLNKRFAVIIDECHIGDTAARKAIIDDLNPLFIIYASATPKVPKKGTLITVSDDEVISEGLITRLIKVNSDLPSSTDIEAKEHEDLLKIAIKTYKSMRNKYAKLYQSKECSLDINPLILIQYPNNRDSEDLLGQMKTLIANAGFTEEQQATWMTVNKAEIKENLANITDPESPIIFLHMKQAVATGWDCPRAKILVKLRENGNVTFETQVIGRLRRMPERRHYNDSTLDNCFVYTYDSNWIEAGEKQGTFKIDKKISLKSTVTSPELEKEKRNNVAHLLSTKELTDVVKDYYFHSYNLVSNHPDNPQKLQYYGYSFDKYSYKEVKEGSVIHTDLLTRETQTVTRRISLSKNSPYVKKALAEIKKASKTNDLDAITNILKNLFLEKNNLTHNNYPDSLLSLTPMEFNAFVVNNEDKLKDDFKKAFEKNQNQTYQRNLAKSMNQLKTERIPLPTEYDIKVDSRVKRGQVFNKNAYDGFELSVHCSAVEKQFMDWIDKYPKTEWWMKNGDTGDEFFSVVYMTIVGKQYQFYPDFICKIDGKIWIIETKGGETADGKDENIDPQAENKFYALSDWQLNHPDFNFGFVRYSKLQSHLYMSVTDYTEDLEGDNSKAVSSSYYGATVVEGVQQAHFESPWKEIEEILK